MRKRISCILMVIIMMMFMFNTIEQNTALAKNKCDISEIEEIIHEETEFEKAYNEDEYVKRKVDEELSNATGIISDEMEEVLNKKGIFDDEIKKIDDTTIEEINNSDLDEVYIGTEFYRYEEKIDDNGNVIETNIVEMDEEDIEEAIGEEYYGVSDNEEESASVKTNYKNKKDSLIRSVGKTLGIIPVETYAATAFKYTTQSTMMKKTVIITPVNEYYKMHCTCEWKDMPVYRNVDLMQLCFVNASFNSNAFTRSKLCVTEEYFYFDREYGKDNSNHSVVIRERYGETGNKNYIMDNPSKAVGNSKFELNGGHFVVLDKYLVAAVDLPEDASDGTREYIGALITCDIYLKLDDGNDTFYYNFIYEHIRTIAKVKVTGLKVKFPNNSVCGVALNIAELCFLNRNPIIIAYTADRCGGDNHQGYCINTKYSFK